MPVETRAFPLDHEMTSAGTASIFSVGFDNGRMMGRSTPLAHLLDDLLGEGVVVGGGADEDRRVNLPDRLHQTDMPV